MKIWDAATGAKVSSFVGVEGGEKMGVSCGGYTHALCWKGSDQGWDGRCDEALQLTKHFDGFHDR